MTELLAAAAMSEEGMGLSRGECWKEVEGVEDFVVVRRGQQKRMMPTGILALPMTYDLSTLQQQQQQQQFLPSLNNC